MANTLLFKRREYLWK